MLLKNIPRFYPIIDTSQIPLQRIEEAALAIIEAGAGIIQLRGKNIPSRDILKLGRVIKQIADKNNVLFIINDRVDIAILANASGVHLGQDDIPIREARKILGKDKIIGISTHNIKEAVCACKNGADYISFGPIFATKTKKDAQEPKGIEALQNVRRNADIPIVAIGGITLENAADVYNAGADSIAVISDILKSNDIRERVRGFISLL